MNKCGSWLRQCRNQRSRKILKTYSRLLKMKTPVSPRTFALKSWRPKEWFYTSLYPETSLTMLSAKHCGTVKGGRSLESLFKSGEQKEKRQREKATSRTRTRELKRSWSSKILNQFLTWKLNLSAPIANCLHNHKRIIKTSLQVIYCFLLSYWNHQQTVTSPN